MQLRTPIRIDAQFESGNLEVIDASDPANIRVTVRPDPPTETDEGTVRYRQQPGQGDMRICKSAVSQRFDCYATTLEMPFKHGADRRGLEEGWSPPRCRRMGASALDAVAAVVRQLLTERS